MEYKVVVSLVAQRQLKEAISYYQKHASKKVANNFILDYEQTVLDIKLNPFYRVYYKNIRGLIMKKYPFIILYQIKDESVLMIKAVFHTKQNPRKRP